jgi:hypothetical protein
MCITPPHLRSTAHLTIAHTHLLFRLPRARSNNRQARAHTHNSRHTYARTPTTIITITNNNIATAASLPTPPCSTLTHSLTAPLPTRNRCSMVRVWEAPDDFYEPIRDALIQRATLIPYIYTAARESHTSGLGLLRPM